MPAAPPYFAFRISFFYAAVFVVGGITTPYLPVWLKVRGFTPEMISLCLALPLLARLVFTPFGSWFADRAPNRRFAIIIFSFGAFGLFLPAALLDLPLVILVFTGLAVTVSGQVQPTTDALALTGYRRFGLDYGSMRVWGSISFVLVSLAAGAIMGRFGEPILTELLIGGFAIASLAAFALPVTPARERALDDAARPRDKPAWAILTRRSFVAVALSTSLIQASHGVFYGFGSIHWTNLGFSGNELGVLWATGVIAEIMMLRFSGRLRRIGAEGFIMLGAAGAILRWALFPLISDFAPSMALQALHGLTFAATFIGMQMGIARDVDEERTASAQGVCQIVSGLLMALTTLIAGPLYARFGIESIWAMVAAPALALVVLWWLGRPVNPTEPASAG